MEDKKFKVIIVEDVKLELKGTEEIFRHEIPNAEVIGTAMTESEFWTLIEAGVPDLVLLDLGLVLLLLVWISAGIYLSAIREYTYSYLPEKF